MHPTRTQSHIPLKPLSLAIALSCAQMAYAADTEQQLDVVQVTATRGNDTNTVVRANRLSVGQANSLQDIFRQTPEVDVGGGLPGAQKIYVRGMSERMLNITIDGAAQPESAYHHTGQIMIEPELIKRVEVEAGTGAATAGPGALAGAVRFTTKSADDLLRPGEQFGGIVNGGYQSVSEGYKLGTTLFGRFSDKVDVLASVNYLNTNDYKDGHGDTVANSASEMRSGFVKLGVTPSEGQRLELAQDYRDEEGIRNKRTNLLPAKFNLAQKQRTERNSTTLNYDYDVGNPLLNLHMTAFHNENAIELALNTPDTERLGSKSYGLNLSNVSRVGSHKLSYGLDFKNDTGFAELPDTVVNDEDARVVGVYLQDDIALGDMFLLGLGARYDRYSYTDSKDQKFDSNGFSPSASLAFTPMESLTLRLSHARALRGVGIVEPFLKQYQDNDSHIEAEKARNTELNAQWQQGGWHVGGSIFDQRIDNFIGYDDYRDNMGTVKSKGYTASAGYQAEQLSASLGMSYSKPELNGQPLADENALLLGTSTGRTWVAQIDYAIPANNLKLGWTTRLTEELSHVPAGDDKKPGYNVHDFYVQWLPTGKDTLRLTLTVKNVFDSYYVDQASFGFHPRWGKVAGLPEAGRDIRAAVAVRF
jgi:hemoglobin/transferrin/lactoferrin receptor protein